MTRNSDTATELESENGTNARTVEDDFPQSHCCCAHDWPYFKTPVHPYDYSDDWDLETEWNRRLGCGKPERADDPDGNYPGSCPLCPAKQL